MTMAPQQVGIGIRRHFTTEGVHPYDEVEWEVRTARITNFSDGSVAFEQSGVEVPKTWSLNATNILAQKYFRGTPGTPERETSLRQVVDRIVDTITSWGSLDGYFVDGEEARAFSDELKHLIVNQKAAFNSPVWFNIGVAGVPQQASACFILAVEDSMSSILNWYTEEGIIFKGGSGSGINLSTIRSSKEGLKGGGTASGPVSFMRGADASAGTIKSGGKTRRAAKMVILNVDHPDVRDFIWCKAIEERKARVLRDAGFDMDLDGKDIHSVQYQNANNSVRVTDEFMQAVIEDRDWDLKAVTDSSVIETVRARELFREIAQAAWECADPGLQFDTTINRWHTAPNAGRINASNPCSEYMHLDNSACNLASLNLMKFIDEEGNFDVEGFKAAIEVVFTAQEILVGNADYPTPKIADTSRRFRQLGLGYANLGALLMAEGLPYDSDEGRAWAGAITALMTGHAYAVSSRIAARMGPFAGFHDNAEAMIGVLKMHRAEVARIDETKVPVELLSAAQEAWDTAVELGETYGVRNSQATVLAPTGCLVGGTLVPTERGLVRLGSLGDPVGDQWQDLSVQVQTHEGPRDATKFFVNGVEPVVTVTTSRGYALSGTARHRVKVVDTTTGAWQWKRLSDLTESDLVPLALAQLIGEPQVVSLPPLPEAHWAEEHHVSAPRRMTPELAELIGYFMGNGFLHSRGLRFRVASEDFDVVERLEHLGKECFGIVGAVIPRGRYTEVRFDSVRLVQWWESCDFAKVPPVEGHRGDRYVAHVPNAILYSNDPTIYASFLRGLYEANGDVSAGCPTFKNTSPRLVDDVQSILLALGFPTNKSVSERRTGWGTVSLGSLRLLNSSYNERWLREVGFISGSKNARVNVAGGDTQACRKDCIPLTPALVDRLTIDNDRMREALLTEVHRGRVSRELATELYEQTGDADLGHLLNFFYDTVASVELGDEELTYDLSVPDNVSYVANGFVSHNTIGLLMDCDTTGIEPDLGLVKTKKLVGGGTMSIVNQTVQRALGHLGYSAGEIEEIVRYIDEHKSIIGAPHLDPAHLPVFACSMGDNVIHHMGHIKMMAAVQPFISGAISKTVNLPEDVTVGDVEEAHLEAWRLGLKAIAIYRDNCKVAQPLSTTNKAAASKVEASARDPQLAQRIEELERMLQTEVAVKRPVRERLPRRRRSSTFHFRVADCEGYVTVGEYEDGRPGEVFMKVSKQGSTLAGIMDAFSIAVSLGLQHGVPLSTFVRKYTNMRFEPAGMTDDPDLRIATSLVDYIFRRLAVDYLDRAEREELGVLTSEERIQPTLPGVEEAAAPTHGRLDDSLGDQPTAAAQPILSPGSAGPSAAEPSARGQVRDAPYCYQCGNVMQRAGSCFVCPACGTTSGCS
jgi:ribonucleoside-diphosphate reductase alpha chain